MIKATQKNRKYCDINFNICKKREAGNELKQQEAAQQILKIFFHHSDSNIKVYKLFSKAITGGYYHEFRNQFFYKNRFNLGLKFYNFVIEE